MATILIVDDRSSTRQYLTTLLGYGGHRLLEAVNGEDALRLMRASRPDLVITDILMPTMDGFEFVQRLRADPALLDTRVIFHTATYSAPEAQKLAASCGVRTVLPKPCEPQQVFDAVERELGAQSANRAPASAPRKEGGLAGGRHEVDDTLSQKFKDLQAAQRKVERFLERSRRGERDQRLWEEYSGSVSDLQRLATRLSALVEVALETMQERDPARLVKLFFGAACEIIDAEFVALCIVGDDEQAPLHAMARNFDPAIFREAGAARAGLPGSLLGSRRVLRAHGAKLKASAEGLPPGHPAVRSFLGVTIATSDQVYGWLYFADRRGAEKFSAEDERVAAILAAKLALLYENSQLYDVIQRHAAKLQVESAERIQAQLALREREAGLRRAQVMARLAHAITRPDGSFESWSETLPELIGQDPDRLPSSTREWLALVHADDQALFRESAIDAGAKAAHKDLEYRLWRADGSMVSIRHVMEPIEGSEDSHGRSRWFNTLQDVTERKAAEDRVRRLNRVYAVLSGINTLIVRVRDRDELFREACRIAVEDGKFRLAWLGLVDRQAMRVRPVAWRGAGEDYIRMMPLDLGGTVGAGRGLSAHAIRERKAMVSDDMTLDPRVLLKKEAAERGFRSLAVLPLIVGGEAVGVLGLYAGEVGFFDDEEMKLLLELAGDIAFAMEHLETLGKVEYLDFHDPLTGLPNREVLVDRLGQMLSIARRDSQLAGVMFLDMERFRLVNDTLGRQVGDEFLKAVTERLKAAVRTQDTVARIAGDMFAVAVASFSRITDATHLFSERLARAFGAPVVVNGQELRSAFKTGIAVFPGDGDTAELLCRNAEAALKKAKASGERYVFYTPEINARVAESLALENQLRRALEAGEFVLHYQPKVETKSRRLVGVEALIRWNHPQRGLVPPGKFIPLMEETGLILEAGSWALRRAVADVQAWRAKGLAAPRVAVNVSQIQLRQKDFVQSVLRALEGFGDAEPLLDIEITESMVMQNFDASVRALQTLRGVGVETSLDDFGTGYSSLAYVARLPVAMLKIDRSFVVEMTSSRFARNIVETVISLAHSLGLKVIAEGVDEETQAALLATLGCDQMQGYLISKPVPPAQIEAMLAKA